MNNLRAAVIDINSINCTGHELNLEPVCLAIESTMPMCSDVLFDFRPETRFSLSTVYLLRDSVSPCISRNSPTKGDSRTGRNTPQRRKALL